MVWLEYLFFCVMSLHSDHTVSNQPLARRRHEVQGAELWKWIHLRTLRLLKINVRGTTKYSWNWSQIHYKSVANVDISTFRSSELGSFRSFPEIEVNLPRTNLIANLLWLCNHVYLTSLEWTTCSSKLNSARYNHSFVEQKIGLQVKKTFSFFIYFFLILFTQMRFICWTMSAM